MNTFVASFRKTTKHYRIFSCIFVVHIVVSSPQTAVHVAVEAKLTEGSSFQIHGYNSTPSLLPVFKCNFAEGTNRTYVYDIFWYINEYKIRSYYNILMEDVNTKLLRHTDWIDSFKMNMEVCVPFSMALNNFRYKGFSMLHIHTCSLCFISQFKMCELNFHFTLSNCVILAI